MTRRRTVSPSCWAPTLLEAATYLEEVVRESCLFTLGGGMVGGQTPLDSYTLFRGLLEC